MARDIEILKVGLQEAYEDYILRDVPDVDGDINYVPIKIKIKENLLRLTNNISVTIDEYVGDGEGDYLQFIENIYNYDSTSFDSTSLIARIDALETDSTSIHLDIDDIYQILADSTSGDSTSWIPRVEALELDSTSIHLDIDNIYQILADTTSSVDGTSWIPRVTALETDTSSQYGFYTGYTVETVFKDGTKRLKPDIQTAIDDAYTYGGSVIVHPNSTYYDETVTLKDGVNIELKDGVILQSTSSYSIYNDSGDVVTASIFGKGIIKNTNNTVIEVRNTSSNINIECKEIISEGFIKWGIYSTINNLKVNCDYIYSKYYGIYHRLLDSTFNLNIDKILTGDTTSAGGTALLLMGNGVIDIDEIICTYSGHTFRYDGGGECYADIRKQTMTRNYDLISTTAISVLRSQSVDPCKLNLYFDEILALNGSETTASPIQVQRGEINLIGRRIYTDNDNAITYQTDSTSDASGLINVHEIESANWSAVDINTKGKVIIKDSSIIGNVNSWGALNLAYTYNTDVEIINTKISNLSDGTDAYGVQIGEDSTGFVMDSVSIEMTTDLVGKSMKSDKTQNLKIKRPTWVNAPYDEIINITGNLIGSF